MNLTLAPLLDPRLPLLEVWNRLYKMPPTAPFEVVRNDGSIHSGKALRDVFSEVARLTTGGFGDDLLNFMAMHGAVRLGDYLKRANLDEGDPLLEFARHLRNACAHGNRWHFRPGQPSRPATLRGRTLDRSLQGTQAIPDWLGPGDYLDFLDDLASLLRSGGPAQAQTE
jgi:hypothetical protein